jgi:hypothetical protein
VKDGKGYKMRMQKVRVGLSWPIHLFSQVHHLLWAILDFVPLFFLSLWHWRNGSGVMETGKIVQRCAGKQHLLSKKNAKSMERLSKVVREHFFFTSLTLFLFC